MLQKYKDIHTTLKGAAFILVVDLVALLFFTVLMIVVTIFPKLEKKICRMECKPEDKTWQSY